MRARHFWNGLLLLCLLTVAAHASKAQEAPPRVQLPATLTPVDRVSYVLKVGDTHKLCWGNGNAQTNIAIRFYRYRVEGGPVELYRTIPFAQWVAEPVATNYCTAKDVLEPKAGHWIYEAEFCFTPIAADGSNCSLRVSAACPAGSAETCAGMVEGANRGWWVYAYLPAPTGAGVN